MTTIMAVWFTTVIILAGISMLAEGRGELVQ